VYYTFLSSILAPEGRGHPSDKVYLAAGLTWRSVFITVLSMWTSVRRLRNSFAFPLAQVFSAQTWDEPVENIVRREGPAVSSGVFAAITEATDDLPFCSRPRQPVVFRLRYE